MRSSPSWQFQLFNYPVRVHASFLLMGLLFGVAFSGFDLVRLLVWMVVFFLAIMIHELGHAIANQIFGRSSYIEIHGMGGLTVSSRFGPTSYGQDIFTSFAGPLAGFLAAGLAYLLMRFIPSANAGVPGLLLGTLYSICIFWGIFNLIPMLPLDGGNIMRSIVHMVRGPYEDRLPLIISVVFGVLTMIAVLVLFRSPYMLLIIAMLTLSNWQKLRQGFYTDTIY